MSELSLAVCGAPLAARARDVAAALAKVGWSVSVEPSAAAVAWTGDVELQPPPGRPDERRRPDLVVACPLTFNTVNKIVRGVMDTRVAGVLCDGLGAKVPIVAVPMVNDRLWGHPAWAATLAQLSSWGVVLLDAATGRAGSPQPVASGQGGVVSAAFDPAWLVAATGPARRYG